MDKPTLFELRQRLAWLLDIVGLNECFLNIISRSVKHGDFSRINSVSCNLSNLLLYFFVQDDLKRWQKNAQQLAKGVKANCRRFFS